MSTWPGWLYVTFVIDVFARRIVGWRVSRTMQTDFVLDALDQAGIKPSVGSKGDSYDNAQAETINGLCKAGLIHRRGPWKNRESVELATLHYWQQLAATSTSTKVST